jgi:thiamine monophosphate kinase
MEYVVKKIQLKEKTSDYLYWMSKTPQERLDALEFLRSLTYTSIDVSQGLQRVCSITQRKQS